MPISTGTLAMTSPPDSYRSLERTHIDELFRLFTRDGFEVVGPRKKDGAIIYGRIDSVADLPEGWTDRQEPGSYRMEKRDDRALFGYAVGPHSWKQFLFPPELTLWKTTRDSDGSPVFQANNAEAPSFAFIGVRACELAAIKIQDRVFGGGSFQDSNYNRRRRQSIIVAVNCGQAADTCFCVSMGTGPGVESGFDISMTEIIENDSSRFVAEAGSDTGEKYLAALDASIASADDREQASQVVEDTAASIPRSIDTTKLPEVLQSSLELTHWDKIASRCLSCTNCTLVCPTCFCHSTFEKSDLQMQSSEHVREWDSCFTNDFTAIGGESVRSTTKSQYRQWMTHKLGTWVQQFGTSGCVGCGRCIAWCPVGIDITEEAANLRLAVSSESES